MSKQGRAMDLLTDWRDHPRNCTAEHGWPDGYDGPCTDDPFVILEEVRAIMGRPAPLIKRPTPPEREGEWRKGWDAALAAVEAAGVTWEADRD